MRIKVSFTPKVKASFEANISLDKLLLSTGLKLENFKAETLQELVEVAILNMLDNNPIKLEFSEHGKLSELLSADDFRVVFEEPLEKLNVRFLEVGERFHDCGCPFTPEDPSKHEKECPLSRKKEDKPLNYWLVINGVTTSYQPESEALGCGKISREEVVQVAISKMKLDPLDPYEVTSHGKKNVHRVLQKNEDVLLSTREKGNRFSVISLKEKRRMKNKKGQEKQ